MDSRILRLTFASAVLAHGLAVSGLAASLTVETHSVPSEWVVLHQGKPLLRYAFAPGRYKPYVKELATLGGRNLLRDAPSDHLHHHALMYAIAVNGLSFWEEAPGAGIQKPIESTAGAPVFRGGGSSEVSFVQVLHWLAPQNAFLADTTGQALLVERRTLTLQVDEPRREVALLWRSEFEVGQATNVVTLGGSSYFGLGVRFLEELDPLAVHLTDDGSLDLSNNRQDISQHSWMAVSFDSPRDPATLAILGDPNNDGGEPWFFSMKTPFAYLSATQHLDQQPRRHVAGDRFALQYLVLLIPATGTTADIEARYQRWLTDGVGGLPESQAVDPAAP